MEVRKGYKIVDEVVIPTDWELVPLGDFLQFKNGLNKEKHYFGAGTPIVNYMDVYKNRGLTKDNILGRVTLTTQEIKNYEVKKGDILFTRTSETVDEIGVSSVILEEMPNTVFSGFVLRARPKDNRLIPLFAKYCFSTNAVRKEIISQSTYTTRALTNGRNLLKVKIALPRTKEEQLLIATVLTETDVLLDKLEKVIKKKRSIKHGAMQRLLYPKAHWEMKTYGKVFSFLNTATYSRAELSDSESVGYIHYGDIHTKWNLFLDVKKNNLPTIAEQQVKSYSLVKNGDVIMTDASEDYSGVGKSVEVKNLGNRKLIAGLHTFLLRDTNENFVDGYRGYIHISSFVKNQFDRLATGMKVFGISKTNLKTVAIPVPPREEQIEIAQILSEMDLEISNLEEKLEKYKQVKQGMMQQLLIGQIRLI